MVVSLKQIGIIVQYIEIKFNYFGKPENKKR